MPPAADAVTDPPPPASHDAAPAQALPPTVEATPVQARGPGGLDTDALRRSWPDVLDWLSRHKRVTWTFVSQNAQVADYDGHRVLLGISTVGLADTFRRGAHADYVRQALIDVLGVDAPVEGVPADDAGSARATSGAGPGRPATAPEAGASGGPPSVASNPVSDEAPKPPAVDAEAVAVETSSAPGTRAEAAPGARRPASEPSQGSWSDAPPPRDGSPPWAGPSEATGPTEAGTEGASAQTVDDTAISDDDESIDELADVGVPVVERLLGGTVISEDSR